MAVFAILLFAAPLWAAEVSHISKQLGRIQTAAREKFGQKQVHIVGGSAFSLVRTIWQKRDFTFRDLDIVIVANQEVTPELARAFGQELEERGVGEFSQVNLRPRPRFNPTLFGDSRDHYNAGYGFFVEDKGIIYDIILFHGDSDISLNGVLNSDRIRVKIAANERLKNIVQESKTQFAERLEDPEVGLQTAVSSTKPRVINWGELRRIPATGVLRLIRSLSHFKALPLSTPLANDLREILNLKQEAVDELQVVRGLDKILNDAEVVPILQELQRVGFFDQHYSSATAVVKKLGGENNPLLATEGQNPTVIFARQLAPLERLKFAKYLYQVRPDLGDEILQGLPLEKVNLGYFTGGFAPFHNGHLGVVRSALIRGSADFVLVIPTPFVNNSGKVTRFSLNDWQERIEFAELALKNEPNVMVWTSRQDDNQKLSQEIVALDSMFDEPEKLVHIMGADSFHRAVEREIIEKYPRRRVVVARDGVVVPPYNDPEEWVSFVGNMGQPKVSASEILIHLALGLPVDGWMSPEVEKQLRSLRRYKDLFRAIRREHEALSQHLKPLPKNFSGRPVVIDFRPNPHGVWLSEHPELTRSHFEFVQYLLKKKPAEVFIIVSDPESHKVRQWKERLRQIRGFGSIHFVEQVTRAKERSAIFVLHSGSVNEAITDFHLIDTLGKSRYLLVYETVDRPLSDAAKQLENLSVVPFTSGSEDCVGIVREQLKKAL